MRDIIQFVDGEDITIMDSITPKAANIISTQIGFLDYEITFGVDLRYFLSENLAFQNESFKSYLVDRLIQSRVNVVDVLTIVENFIQTFSFEVGEQDSTEGFIK